MTWEQGTILVIIVCTLAALMRDRWRYDIVAMTSLLVAVLLGIVPADAAFSGFSDPAVVTVVAVLVISSAVAKSGFVEYLGARLTTITAQPFHHLAAICIVGIAISAFMNNVAALTLLLPFVLSTAKRFGYAPGLVLMPLSFATLLGGMITLIGTPANLLVSSYRFEATGSRFGMFDFLPVGLCLALVGLVYLLVTGWLISRDSTAKYPAPKQDDEEDMFDVADYVTEARVGPAAAVAGQSVGAIEQSYGIVVVGVVRAERRVFGWLRDHVVRVGDVLLLQGETRRLETLLNQGGLELLENSGAASMVTTMEAVVMPNSLVLGSTPASLDLPERYNVNLLAAARQGRRFEGRLAEATLNVGDVLLLEGPPEAVRDAIKGLGCLPLAARRLNLSPRRILLPIMMFVGAIALTALDILAPQIAFMLCAIGMIMTRAVKPAEALSYIDLPVVILLGAMIPLGAALQTTGAASLIAQTVMAYTGGAGPFALLAVTLIATMALTPMLNNATTVIIMAPIALSVAHDVGAAPEAFLMAVAVGASADFLTPFGHHNNTIILGPGGYRIRDYVRLGLPLSVLIIAVALTIIPFTWPF
jgi:di/tricarboxylate transporter